MSGIQVHLHLIAADIIFMKILSGISDRSCGAYPTAELVEFTNLLALPTRLIRQIPPKVKTLSYKWTECICTVRTGKDLIQSTLYSCPGTA
jgi:hypothetical protein